MSEQTTGAEYRTPLRIIRTSATERATFRRCHRQWFLGIAHRLGNIEGNSNFLFGTALHDGLAEYYLAKKDGATDRQARVSGFGGFDGSWDAAMKELADDLGFLWPTYAAEYAEMGSMGRSMLTGYFDRERTSPLGKPVSIEERFEVPILSPGGAVVGMLSCQLDIVVEQTNSGRLAIVDHKGLASSPNVGQLDFDDQLTAYIWARWKFTGEWVREAIYNVLLKKVPHPPRLLKSGKLSVDRQQTTTYDLYVQAIKDHGLIVNDYAEHLLWLKDEGPKLFVREGVFRTMGQMDEFARNLYHEFMDMKKVAARPEIAYPNPSAFNCPSCSVKTICMALMNGEDAETIIRNDFVVLPARY